MQASSIEIGVLQPLKLQKELLQVSSWVFIEQLNYQMSSGGYIAMKLLHNKPLLNKWNKDFQLKKIYKKLVQIRREKKIGCFENKSDNF